MIFSVKEETKFLQYGPGFNERRVSLACGVFNSDEHNGRPLIVVAGWDMKDKSKTSEYWDFTSSGSKWVFCSEYLCYSFLLTSKKQIAFFEFLSV